MARLLPSPAALERLVYLVGPARGGTSVMHAAMEAHPEALVLPGVSHFLQQVWRYRDVVHERLLRQIIQLNAWDQSGLETRLDAAQTAEFRRIVNAAFAARDLAALYKLLPIAHALSPSFVKSPAGIVCWHDKSNDWRYLGALARAFPAARFIFVVRDPRSVVLSGALRLSAKSGEAAPRLDAANIVDMALYWRLIVQRCLHFAHRHPERSRVVRFEDFVADPVGTLKALFDFTAGRVPADDEIERGLTRVIGGATNNPGALYHGISNEPLARWQTAMPADQLALVAQLTAPTAGKLGYEITRRRGPFASVSALGSVGRLRPRARATAKALIEEAWEPFVRLPIPSSGLRS